MSTFGYSYPAGAENDPSAPYNQDAQLDNDEVRAAFLGFDSLHALHKHVANMPQHPRLGVRILFYKPDFEGMDEEIEEWFWADNLQQWGTWADMDDGGYLITGLAVNCDIEGLDLHSDTLELFIDEAVISADINAWFYTSVTRVSEQAKEVWHASEYAKDGEAAVAWGNRVHDEFLKETRQDDTHDSKITIDSYRLFNLLTRAYLAGKWGHK